jgi:hypothetical protein
MRQPIYIASSPASISNNFARGSRFLAVLGARERPVLACNCALADTLCAISRFALRRANSSASSIKSSRSVASRGSEAKTKGELWRTCGRIAITHCSFCRTKNRFPHIAIGTPFQAIFPVRDRSRGSNPVANLRGPRSGQARGAASFNPAYMRSALGQPSHCAADLT